MNFNIIYMVAFTLASLILVHRPAQATHPLATDDTGTQGTGGIEIELFHQASRNSMADSGYQFNTGVSVHVGLSEKVDLGLTTFFQSILSPLDDWRSGVAPPVIDLKWKFWGNAGSRSNVALRLDYSPKPLSTISTGGHDLGALLVNCWNLGDFSMHLNLGGYARDLGVEGALGTLYTGGAMTVPITGKIQAAVEAVYETGPFYGFHAVNGMAGLVWEVSDGNILSIGAGPTWEAGGRVGWTTSVGFTIALPRESAEDES